MKNTSKMKANHLRKIHCFSKKYCYYFTKIIVLVIFTGTIFGFMSCQKNDHFFKESKLDYSFNNEKSRLSITKDEWKIVLFGEDGNERFTENRPPSFLIDGNWESLTKVEEILSVENNSVSMNASLSNGSIMLVEIKSLSPDAFNIVLKSKDSDIISFRGSNFLKPVEEIFGFGEMWNGHVAQRGQEIQIWDVKGTPDECAYMPYYVSTSNYAFFINYGGLVSFDVGKASPEELNYEAPTSYLDFTLVAGNSIASSVENFVSVTGLPAAPPRWAFEPWFWLIHDPEQPASSMKTLKGEHLIQMVKKLKKLDIPIGVTWFEPPWQDANSSFVPNTAFSPDLKDLIKRLDAEGVKTLAWTSPWTTERSSNWEEAVSNKYLVQRPDSKQLDAETKISGSSSTGYNYIDFLNPAAAQWWQDQIEKATELGLKGFKLDSGQDLEEDAILYEGRLGKDFHNSNALEYNKVYYKALKNKLGDDFLMVPRAASIGSSAYHNFKWPGDLMVNFATNGLPSSVYSSISLAFSGVPFVSTDIGGFSGKPTKENVLVRWVQFGAFLPGMQTLHMPWWFSDKTIAHFRYFAWLHNDLAPFWMSLAKEAKMKGTPIIRPLVWNYQDDINTWKVDDEFTVGNDILVAPILDSTASRDVYLPEGTWYDFMDEKISMIGPMKFKWTTTDADSLYRFPLYVKEGAIIPMEISNDATGFGFSGSKSFITLAIWPKLSGISEFILSDREDSVRISCERTGRDKIVVSWSETNKDYILRLHLNDKVEIENVETENSEFKLVKFSSQDDFQSSLENGYFFDKNLGNIWVRRTDLGLNGSVIVKIN